MRTVFSPFTRLILMRAYVAQEINHLRDKVDVLLSRFRNHRFGLVILLTFIIVSISFFTRLALMESSFESLDCTLGTFLGIFLVGVFFDLISASYFVIPLLIYLWLLPESIYTKRWHKYILGSFFSLFIFLLTLNSFSEWFFWDEFTTRFNFIAVDYLVYTTEVIGNITQSYPVAWYVTGVFALTAIVVYRLRSWIFHQPHLN